MAVAEIPGTAVYEVIPFIRKKHRDTKTQRHKESVEKVLNEPETLCLCASVFVIKAIFFPSFAHYFNYSSYICAL